MKEKDSTFGKLKVTNKSTYVSTLEGGSESVHVFAVV